MIKEVKCIVIDELSHPFCSAKERCDLAKHGYLEFEYLFRGTANIYETSGPQTKIKHKNCSYTDRMIIRKPNLVEDFSGDVVVEIINSTAGFDIERIWAESHRYIMRKNMIYVGITSKPNVFPALKRFDKKRYGDLDWPNPLPKNKRPKLSKENVEFNGPDDQEMGYIWDILMDLPQWLKSNASPIGEYNIKRIYLTGWSQSCSYINQFVNRFVTPNKIQVYDGYFLAGGVHKLVTPVNRYEAEQKVDSLECRVDRCDVPLIELNTESENSNENGMCGYDARRENSNRPGFLYRYIDIAGSCHDAIDSARDYTQFDSDVEKALGHPLGVFKQIEHPNAYPKYIAFHVALDQLVHWVKDHIVPMELPRIEQTPEGVNRKDAFGNAIGGLRSSLVDLPLARYNCWVDLKGPNGQVVRNGLFGHEEPFTKKLLQELYGTLEQYESLVRKNTMWNYEHGMILKEDIEPFISFVLNKAKKAGLKKG